MTVGDMFCGDKNADKGKPEFWSESYSLNKVNRMSLRKWHFSKGLKEMRERIIVT